MRCRLKKSSQVMLPGQPDCESEFDMMLPPEVPEKECEARMIKDRSQS